MLSRGETETLLDLYRRDEMLVGMRDYAFMLARLRTGVLRKLRWGTYRPGAVSLADFRNKKAVPAAKTAFDGVGDGDSPAIAGEHESFSPDPSLRSGQGPKLHGVDPPNRNPLPFKPWDGYRHGLYAESQPTEGVAAVLRDNIQGMEEEIVGLRLLGRGLLERQVGAKSSLEGVRLGDAYTKTAARLAEMMRVEKQMAEEEAGKDDTEELLERWDKMAISMGGEPVSEQIRAEAFGESAEMAVGARRLVEEIASIRYVLRNTFQLAMEEEDDGDYRHLVEIYSAGCARLVRLLRMEGYKEDRVLAYIEESIEIALKDVMEELGIG